MTAINRCLFEIGETPLSKNPKCLEDKIEKITGAMRVLFNNDEPTAKQTDESEIILQLKEKFKMTTKKSEQLQILTILPKSWTKKQIESEFGVLDYMARVVSQPHPIQLIYATF